MPCLAFANSRGYIISMKRELAGAVFAILAAVCPAKSASGLTGPATEAFGFDLYRQLAGTDQFGAGGGANLAFSPFCIACVLEELRFGASGDAEKALSAALHIDTASDNSPSITRPGALDTKGVTLAVANSLWLAEKFKPKSEYISSVDAAFGNVVFTVDFAQPASVAKQINQWIGEKTQGHIEDLVSARNFSPATLMAIANAVYFKGLWQTPFKAGETAEQPFHLLSGQDTKVSMMHHEAKYRYATVEDVALLELPYGPGGTSLILLLPEPGPRAMSRLEAVLTKPWFDRAVGALAKKDAIVAIPKFAFSCEPKDMIPVLKTLGLASIFQPSLDFAKISDLQPMAVDLFKHRAWLEVNEQGTEAAAATVTGMRALAMPVRTTPVHFTADHPFLFVIRHHATGAPLFIGRVSDPAKKE